MNYDKAAAVAAEAYDTVLWWLSVLRDDGDDVSASQAEDDLVDHYASCAVPIGDDEYQILLVDGEPRVMIRGKRTGCDADTAEMHVRYASGEGFTIPDSTDALLNFARMFYLVR